MLCPQCGAITSETDPFCRSCGAARAFDSEGTSKLHSRNPFAAAALRMALDSALTTSQSGTEEREPTAGLLPIGATLSHYRIERFLGRGGMGWVYLAHDDRLRRAVAVKVLSTQLHKHASKRIEREAQAAASMSHPNICTVFEIGEADGRTFIAMEYVEGATLREVRETRPLSIPEILDVAIQITDGLTEARKKGVVHRDIKSSNVMLTANGHVKILDFGLARQTSVSRSSDDTLVRTGAVVGTISYMSPEQALARPLDHRSDLFSLGVVLYELITGDLPFTGQSEAEIFDAILHRDPPPIREHNPEAPEDLVRSVNKLLAKEPSHRYQTADEMGLDLRRLRDVNHGGWRGLGWQTSWRSALMSLGGVLAAMATVAAAILLLRAAPERPKSTPIESTRPRSVVVLPCKVYGPTDLAYLVDAVPSTISTLLGQSKEFETRIPPTAGELERVKGDLGRIAEAYRVESFVVSSIAAEPGRLVLNIQLVDAGTRRVQWSSGYAGSLDKYIELTTKAATEVREAIHPRSSPTQAPVGLTAKSDAELAFRQGKYFGNLYNNRHRHADFDLALASFQRALDIDPALAEAAAEIAFLYQWKSEGGELATHQIAEWARRALQINARCSRAWTVLVAAQNWETTFDIPKALSYSFKAVSYDSRDPMAHLALGAALSSSETLSVEASLRAWSLDPLYPYPAVGAALSLLGLGQSSDGVHFADEALRIEANLDYGLFAKSLVLIDRGRLVESGALLNKLKEAASAGRLLPLFVVIAEHGQARQKRERDLADRALLEILRAVDDPTTPNFGRGHASEFVVPLLARHGQREPALHILERVGGSYDVLLLNPDLKLLRGDERFERVVAKARREFATTLSLISEARWRGEFPQYLEMPLADLLRRLDWK